MKNLRWGILLGCFVFIFADAYVGAEVSSSNSKNWEGSAELSVIATNGNSRELILLGKNNFTYHWSQSALELIGRAAATTEQDVTTNEAYFASEEFTRTLTGKNYIYEKTAWDKDRFSGIQDQYNLSAGLGRNILDSSKDKFISEIGAGYINEERASASRDDFASGRVYAKYVRVLNVGSKFTQNIEYFANFNDGASYRLNTETNLTVSISAHCSLKFSYLWRRINQPTPSFGKDKATTSLALVVDY